MKWIKKADTTPGYYGVFVYKSGDQEFNQGVRPVKTFEIRQDALDSANTIWEAFSEEEKKMYYIEVWESDSSGLECIYSVG